MATTADYSRSVLAASDELRDIYCEPCAVNGKKIVAEGFCVDCSEYLCAQCYKNHRKYKAFRHHVLQDKDKMPLDATKAGAIFVCTEKCTLHQTKVIEYFCQSCDTLGCHTCITVNHHQCKNIDLIPNIVKNLEQSGELKEFKSNLDRKLKAVTERKKEISSNKTDIADMKRKAKAELKKQRDEINKFFDYLEEDMDRRIEVIDKNNQENLTAAAFTCEFIHDDLAKMKTDIDTKLKTGQKCELFIAMKKYKPRMEAVGKEFEMLREESKIQRYALTSSTQIKEVIKNTTEICRLTTAKLVSEINVRTVNDKETPFIEGLAVNVQNHFLAVLDDENKSVKVADTRNMKVTCEMRTDCDSVRCIKKVNDDQIAVFVSHGSQEIVQLLSVSKSGSLSKAHKIIIAGGYYYDIVYKGGNFYAVCGKKVRVIDMQGKTVKTINISEYSDRIAISPDNKTIYLKSRNNNTVTSITLNGKVKAIYTDTDLKSRDITVDSDGLVYVLGLGNIHQLTEDCTKIQVLLEDVYGAHITYGNAANQLYVGCWDKVTVYQLE